MEQLLLEILDIIRSGEEIEKRELGKLIDKHNALVGTAERAYAKKKILPFYLRVKNEEPERWASWDINPELEAKLMRTVRMKPRRTASGVATITVITKPWKCTSDCLYCPNDLRMPKSYLHAEPACQRAERNFFDPYLQVVSRLRALEQMGHLCDKVELIVLGGTWSDYPEEYQVWFVKELFRALNEAPHTAENATARKTLYEKCGVSNDESSLADFTDSVQAKVDDGTLRFNAGFDRLYGSGSVWGSVAGTQAATFEELFHEHQINESSDHRVVGLVIETRPDSVTPENLARYRKLGCTKIQIGVQSLDPEILIRNERHIEVAEIQRAFELLRVFGFKIHSHFMVNLMGATPESDKHEYKRFVESPEFMPDEIKLYPCALIEGTRLVPRYRSGEWVPYDENTLVDILTEDILCTPVFTRVSRMIRDFSAGDIVAGNKKTNLRQMVESRIKSLNKPVQEIRYREISLSKVSPDDLTMKVYPYETTQTTEFFLQWVTPMNEIAGFLRLSIPRRTFVEEHANVLPIRVGEAMIREVHVYGSVADFHKSGEGVQHLGLGKQLVEKAKEIARENGFEYLNVISSVGTRGYYRKLGFVDGDLYQKAKL